MLRVRVPAVVAPTPLVSLATAGLVGADSVAVATVWADGVERLDTLVLADDGRVVRVMTHRTAPMFDG
jgi:hypothetical protein